MDKSEILHSNSFSHLYVELKYKETAIGEELKNFDRYETRYNWINSAEKFSKLLLIGYEYLMPVFHIVDENSCYMGTIDRKIIENISKMKLLTIDECDSIQEILLLLKEHNISCDLSKDISTSIYNIYECFYKEKDLLEIPLVENGKLIDVIKKVEFDAFFAREDVRDDISYIADRYSKVESGLDKYSYNKNSQFGEDGIIEYIFKILGLRSYYAVEFGGWDGIYLSNIRKLILENDMNAIFIEGDMEKAKIGSQNYSSNRRVKFINVYVGFKDKKLDEILKENEVPKNVDLLSIDIDGFDYWVWNSLEYYKPRVVVVEYNPTTSNEVILINPKSESEHCGSSPLALVELGKRKGYELAAVTECNCIFVEKEEFRKLELVDNSLNSLRVGGKMCRFQLCSTYQGDVLNDAWGRDRCEILGSIL